MKFINSIALAVSGLLLSHNVAADNVAAVEVLFGDIENNLMEYFSYLQANPTISFPTQYIGLFTAMTTYTDDSYTTLFREIDINQVEQIVTALPWYSSRLESKFEEALTEGMTATTTPSASSTSETASPLTSTSLPFTSLEPSSVPITSAASSSIASITPITSAPSANADSSSSASPISSDASNSIPEVLSSVASTLSDASSLSSSSPASSSVSSSASVPSVETTVAEGAASNMNANAKMVLLPLCLGVSTLFF